MHLKSKFCCVLLKCCYKTDDKAELYLIAIYTKFLLESTSSEIILQFLEITYFKAFIEQVSL